MDVLLDRLEELAGSASASAGRDAAADAERAAEAHMLWRTLEALVASFNPRELRADDPCFATLLRCARSAIDNARCWSVPANPAQYGEDPASVFVFAVRVLGKLAARGQAAREAMMRAGIVSSIMRSLPQQEADARAVAEALHSLTRMATSAPPRSEMADGAPLVVHVMELHSLDAAVQLASCTLLQLLLQEPTGKERTPRAQGVSAVASALRSFAHELPIVTAGLDVLSMMCSHSGWSSPGTNGLGERTEGVVTALVTVLSAHDRNATVVEAATTLLSRLALDQPSLALSSVWTLARLALGAPTDGAAHALADVLAAVVNDQRLMESLAEAPRTLESDGHRTTLRAQLDASSPRRANARDERLEALVRALLDASRGPGAVVHTSQPRLLPPPDDDDDRPSHVTSAPSASLDQDDDQYPMADAFARLLTPPRAASPQRRSPVRPSEMDLASPLPSPTATDDGLSFYEQFMSEAEAIMRPSDPPGTANIPPSRSPSRVPTPRSSPEVSIPPVASSPSLSAAGTRRVDDKHLANEELARRNIHDAPSSTQWQDRCASATRELEALATAHELHDRFHILQRRAEEQSKLLSIQSSRLEHQAHVHQQVVLRMRSLESELAAARTQCQVERELRVAEATQAQRISLTLHDAAQEIQELHVQRSSASRARQETEKLRVDYQSRAAEVKLTRLKLEAERDEAHRALQLARQENVELLRQVEESRREGRAALAMREEDVDARKPRVYSEVLLRPGSASGSISRRASPRLSVHNTASAVLKTARHDDRLATDAAASCALYGVNTLESLAKDDWTDPSDPQSISRSEIESSLRSVYELLDASAGGEGVHVATVRRFLLESGLAQPPSVLAADVDVLLARVLAQSHEGSKKTLARKDYASGQLAPAPARVDVRRYRFLDLPAFSEAVTVVGMKRFPRLDLLHVLQNVVALFLLPYRRQFRARSATTAAATGSSSSSNNAPGSSLSRSMSVCLSPTVGGAPPSGCASVVRAILSGLALHIGRGNDHQQLGLEGDASDVRYHSNSSSNNSAGSTMGGADAKRTREDVVYSMLEMHGVLSRECKPLVTIAEFYGSQHHASAPRDELFGLGFELVLHFAMDFEVIPSFMDRSSLKHLHAEVAAYVKTYFALQKKTVPFAADAETLKKAAFLLVLARVAIELFGAKAEFETPERQISALLQWVDNSAGRDKILRKASLPVVIKFSRRLYTPL